MTVRPSGNEAEAVMQMQQKRGLHSQSAEADAKQQTRRKRQSSEDKKRIRPFA
jgi:hypothetical protein